MKPAKARAQLTIGKGDLMPDDAACAKCSYSLRGLHTGGRCPECDAPFIKKPAKARPQLNIGPGDLMPDDAACAKCSYSLRGLRSGGRCPECGASFIGGRRRKYFNDNLTDAPVEYLRRLAAGCWMLAIGGVASSICLWAGLPSRLPFLAGAALFAGLWWAGVLIVTRPRQTAARSRDELEGEWRRTRRWSLVTQLGWVAAGAAFTGAGILHNVATNWAATSGAALVATPAEQTLGALGWLAYAVGIAGLVPLCLILADLADWAGNTNLGDRYRDSAWAMCVGIPCYLVSYAALRALGGSGVLGFALNVVRVLSILAVVAGSLVFLASLIRLAGMSLWAISNAETGAQRDERLAERQRRHEEELAARAYSAPPPLPGAPSRTSAPVRAGPLSKTEGHYMPRAGDIQPYELAPDDDPGQR